MSCKRLTVCGYQKFNINCAQRRTKSRLSTCVGTIFSETIKNVHSQKWKNNLWIIFIFKDSYVSWLREWCTNLFLSVCPVFDDEFTYLFVVRKISQIQFTSGREYAPIYPINCSVIAYVDLEQFLVCLVVDTCDTDGRNGYQQFLLWFYFTCKFNTSLCIHNCFLIYDKFLYSIVSSCVRILFAHYCYIRILSSLWLCTLNKVSKLICCISMFYYPQQTKQFYMYSNPIYNE